MPVNIERVSIAAAETAEAVPVSARSLMINGKTAGETSPVRSGWPMIGRKRIHPRCEVQRHPRRCRERGRSANREFGGAVQLTVDNISVYLTGRGGICSKRIAALSIAGGGAKGDHNLLKIDDAAAGAADFAEGPFCECRPVETLNLGINFFGAPPGIPFSTTTGHIRPHHDLKPSRGRRAHILLAAELIRSICFCAILILMSARCCRRWQLKNLLQILSEPNLLGAINGKEASFVARR